jgi:hypothetical protein
MPKDRKQETLTAGLPAVTRKYLRYDPEVAARVCEIMMIEGFSLRKICEMPGMPSRQSIFNWLEKSEEFRQRYETARMMQAELLSHQIIEIADDTSGDFVINERGERVVDHENINRSRLRIDARFRLMGKLNPAKYAERTVADLTVRRDMRDITELTDAELLRIATGGTKAEGDGEEQLEPANDGRRAPIRH